MRPTGCSTLIRPTMNTQSLCASHGNPVSRALAAPGASERLFDFRGARQVPAVIRGSCAAGCPRPPSASLDPHSDTSRAPHGFRRGGHHHQLVHSVHVHAGGGLSAARALYVCSGVTRSSDRSSGCAPGNHHLCQLSCSVPYQRDPGTTPPSSRPCPPNKPSVYPTSTNLVQFPPRTPTVSPSLSSPLLTPTSIEQRPQRARGAIGAASCNLTPGVTGAN